MRFLKQSEWLLLGGCILFAFLPAFASDYAVWIAVRIMVLSIAVISLNLLVGYTGLVSFGHAAFFGVGAYAAAIATLNGYDSALVAWPIAVLAAGLLALLIGVLALRTSGVYLIMVTLAFAQMIYYVFVGLDQYGGDDGLRIPARNSLPGVDLSDVRQFFWVVMFLFLVVLIGSERLVSSRFGRVLMGIKDNEVKMRSLGYDTPLYKLAIFSLAGTLAGLGGALMVNLNEQASPAMLHWILSGDMLIMVALGGVGTISGPVLGVAAFVLLEHVLSGVTRHWMAILGPLMLLVILFQHKGIAGLIAQLRRTR